MTSSQKHPTVRQASPHQGLDLIAQDSLKTICAAPGPFVTIFLPARHPAAADLPRFQGLKTILRDGANGAPFSAAYTVHLTCQRRGE